MHMAISSLATTASKRQMNRYFFVNTGLAWTPTSPNTWKVATNGKLVNQITVRLQYCWHCCAANRTKHEDTRGFFQTSQRPGSWEALHPHNHWCLHKIWWACFSPQQGSSTHMWSPFQLMDLLLFSSAGNHHWPRWGVLQWTSCSKCLISTLLLDIRPATAKQRWPTKPLLNT